MVLVSEKALCGNYISGDWHRLVAHVRSQLISQHSNDFVSYFSKIFIYFLSITSNNLSILLPATDERFRSFYRYIGITLSDYNVAQGSRNFNMGCCIKSQKTACLKYRKW